MVGQEWQQQPRQQHSYVALSCSTMLRAALPLSSALLATSSVMAAQRTADCDSGAAFAAAGQAVLPPQRADGGATRVCIIGAGVEGVCSAYFLAQKGYDVTVLEAEAAPALLCSQRNAGVMFATEHSAFATRERLFMVMTSLAKRIVWPFGGGGTPTPPWHLKGDTLMEGRFWRWAIAFAKRALFSDEHELVLAMETLELRGERVMAELLAREGLSDASFHVKRNGAIKLYSSEDSLAHGWEEAEEVMTRLPSEHAPRKLTPEEAVAIEPSAAWRPHVGAILWPHDATGDCYKFVNALEWICRERYSVAFNYGTRVEEMCMSDGRLSSVRTNKGDVEADVFILCAGSESAVLGEQVGLSLPIYPGRGYSVTVDIPRGQPEETLPVHQVINDQYFYTTRYGNRLRMTGFVEFGGWDKPKTEACVDILLDVADAAMPGCNVRDNGSIWMGRRPLSPDGVPMVGATAVPGLFINSGHGTHGWTFAVASADALATWMTTGEQVAFLDPARF
eukprot:PLAT11119.1.p1 GENE.PLAT11119.1~~PLAT11119.1.p1  ORF type:complete len:507 (+),score=134.08 PLAT11119.1:78-1598(+)